MHVNMTLCWWLFPCFCPACTLICLACLGVWTCAGMYRYITQSRTWKHSSHGPEKCDRRPSAEKYTVVECYIYLSSIYFPPNSAEWFERFVFTGGFIGMGLIALGGATVMGAIGLVAMLAKKKWGIPGRLLVSCRRLSTLWCSVLALTKYACCSTPLNVFTVSESYSF